MNILIIITVCLLIILGCLITLLATKEIKEKRRGEEKAELERFYIVLDVPYSKAQVAAASHIEVMVRRVLYDILKHNNREIENKTIKPMLEEIQKLITEYKLNEAILPIVKEKLYKALASREDLLGIAATFAKKHNL